jgi:hypothetical protein
VKLVHDRNFKLAVLSSAVQNDPYFVMLPEEGKRNSLRNVTCKEGTGTMNSIHRVCQKYLWLCLFVTQHKNVCYRTRERPKLTYNNLSIVSVEVGPAGRQRP